MATSRDLETRLAHAHTDLTHILGTNNQTIRSPLTRARANLTTWAGHGAGRTGLTNTRATHDPTDRIADDIDNGRSPTCDQHHQALARLDKQTIRVEHEIIRLRHLVDAATLTVDPTTAARATSLDECRLCAAVGHHSPVLSRGLCDWCWRLSQRLGPNPEGQPIDPHTDLVLRHCQGRRVTENQIAHHHPIPTSYDQTLNPDQTRDARSANPQAD